MEIIKRVKRLLLLVMLCYITWAVPVYAITSWDSYSDPGRTIVSNNFTATGAIVFMKATGLQKNKDYQAKVYDADPNNYPLSPLLIHVGRTDNNGVFLSQVKPSDYPASVGGAWKAELWKIQPLTLEATDTFTVQASAIPEFPDVVTVIGVLFICVLIFWLMKKRKR